jgi:hypothetical protein
VFLNGSRLCSTDPRYQPRGRGCLDGGRVGADPPAVIPQLRCRQLIRYCILMRRCVRTNAWTVRHMVQGAAPRGVAENSRVQALHEQATPRGARTSVAAGGSPPGGGGSKAAAGGAAAAAAAAGRCGGRRPCLTWGSGARWSTAHPSNVLDQVAPAPYCTAEGQMGAWGLILHSCTAQMSTLASTWIAQTTTRHVCRGGWNTAGMRRGALVPDGVSKLQQTRGHEPAFGKCLSQL